MYTPPVAFTDWVFRWVFLIVSKLKIKQILALRGKRSRNKVSVGEPAEGSFIICLFFLNQCSLCWLRLATVYLFRLLLSVKNLNILNFQRWISRLLYRWRTQRNAIRNANCRTASHQIFERKWRWFRPSCLFQCIRLITSKNLMWLRQLSHQIRSHFNATPNRSSH